MALFGFAGNEGAELVYQGKGGTGSAYKWEAMEQPKVDLKAENQKYKDVNSKLTSLNASMGKAWEVDIPELTEDYMALEQKLKTYEATKNKKDQRNQWYEINKAIGVMNQKILTSMKQRAAYLKEYQNIQADTKGVYNRDPIPGELTADQEINSFRDKKILERGEAPTVTRNTTESAVLAIAKNVDYEPKFESTYEKDTLGRYKWEKKKMISEADLRESIKLSIKKLPQNKWSVLVNNPINPGTNTTLQQDFVQNMASKGVDLTQKTPQEQSDLLLDFITDKLYDGIETGIATSYQIGKSDKISTRSSRGGPRTVRGGKRFGYGVYQTQSANWGMEKKNDDGDYSLTVVPVGPSGPKDMPIQSWVVSGKDYKRITGSTDPTISDTDEMTIRGRLSSIVMNEEKGQQPVIYVAFETKQEDGSSSLGFNASTGRFDGTNPKDVKKITQFAVPYANNQMQIQGWGQSPDVVYSELKADADDKFEKDRKPPVQGGGTKGKASEGNKRNPPKKPK